MRISDWSSDVCSSDLLAGSPFVLQRRRARRGTRRAIERYLDRSLWEDVLRIVDGWPQDTSRERQRYERVRWILRFLYDTALRAAAAVATGESDFQQLRGRWCLTTVGQVCVEGTILLSVGLIEDFLVFCHFQCLYPITAN